MYFVIIKKTVKNYRNLEFQMNKLIYYNGWNLIRANKNVHSPYFLVDIENNLLGKNNACSEERAVIFLKKDII